MPRPDLIVPAIPATARPYPPTPDDVADLGVHYGLPVGTLGEDGDVFTLGHVPARCALAAAVRAWRLAWGERLFPFPHAPLPHVTPEWALFTGHIDDSEDEWLWAVPESTAGAVPITVVCGQDGLTETVAEPVRCPACSRWSTTRLDCAARRCRGCEHTWHANAEKRTA